MITLKLLKELNSKCYLSSGVINCKLKTIFKYPAATLKTASFMCSTSNASDHGALSNNTVSQTNTLSHLKNNSAIHPMPNYPPIDERNFSKERMEKEEWYNKIKALPSIEQKLLELNMPKYYKYYCCMLGESLTTLNGLQFVKYATRTHLIEDLPAHYYEDIKELSIVVAKHIKSDVEDIISIYFGSKIHRKINNMSQVQINLGNFIQELNKIILSAVQDKTHLSELTIDVNPRIEGFWFLGGLEPDLEQENELEKEDENGHITRPMKTTLSPILGVRVRNGLPSVVPYGCSLSQEAAISIANKDPASYHKTFDYKRASIIPGFWAGESHEHSHLYYHSMHTIKEGKQSHLKDYWNLAVKESLILCGFTQALACSLYQGFTPVNDTLYPFVQQSALTDGQKWVFSLFQMNTCSLQYERAQTNEKNNIAWISDEHSLYGTVDEGKVRDLNEEVLALLVGMYLKEAIAREDPSPYLAHYKHVLRKEDSPAEYREEFFHFLLNVLNERLPSKPKPEIYDWERIYKVKFQTRPLDPKLRFFEAPWHIDHFEYHPETRRLDEYSIHHIPRDLRYVYKIKYKPKIHTEELFKHESRTLFRLRDIYPDDHIAFNTMNVNKEKVGQYKYDNKFYEVKLKDRD